MNIKFTLQFTLSVKQRQLAGLKKIAKATGLTVQDVLVEELKDELAKFVAKYNDVEKNPG